MMITTFGILHSHIHEYFGRVGNWVHNCVKPNLVFVYTPTTCFETFPFPRPTDAQRQAIAAAAHNLNQLRETWLMDPLDEQGRPYLEGSAELRRRTLTNLYNQNPTWLQNAHA